MSEWERGLNSHQQKAYQQQRDMYPDPVIGNQEISVAQWLMEAHPQLDTSTVVRNKNRLMAGIAAQNGWDEAKTDTSAFYNRIAGELKFQDGQQRLVEGIEPGKSATAEERRKVWDESLRQMAYKAAAELEIVDDPSEADTASLSAFTQWAQAASGKEGYNPQNTGMYLEKWNADFAAGLSDKQKAVEASKSAYPIVATSADIGGGDLEKALTIFRGLTPEQRAMAVKHLDVIHRDAEPGLVEEMGETPTGGAGQAFIGMNRAQLNMWRNMADAGRYQKYHAVGEFKEGMEIDAKAAKTSLDAIVTWAHDWRGDPEYWDRGPKVVKLSKEHADQLNEFVGKRQADEVLKFQLRNMAQGKFDGLKRETLWQKAYLGAAETLPAMAYTVTPFGAPVRLNSYTYEAKMSLVADGVPEKDAAKMATYIGAAQFGLDYARLAFLRKVPGVSNIFNKMASAAGGSATMRFAGKAGATLVGEMAVELTQDVLAEAVVKDVYAWVTGNIPGTDWSKTKDDIWNAAPNTLAAMLLLAPFGAGISMAEDVKNMDQVVRNPAALRLLQYDEKTIETIVSAPAGVAQTIFKDEWKNRGVAEETKGLTPYDAYQWVQKNPQEKAETATAEVTETPEGFTVSETETVFATQEEAVAAVVSQKEAAADAAIESFVQAESNTFSGTGRLVPDAQLNQEAGISQFYRDSKTGWHLKMENGKIINGGDVNTASNLRIQLGVQNMKDEIKELEEKVKVPEPEQQTQTNSTNEKVQNQIRQNIQRQKELLDGTAQYHEEISDASEQTPEGLQQTPLSDTDGAATSVNPAESAAAGVKIQTPKQDGTLQEVQQALATVQQNKLALKAALNTQTQAEENTLRPERKPPELSSAEVEALDAGATGIKNAVTDELRKRLGLESAQKFAEETHEEVIAAAIARIEKDPEYPNRLILELSENIRQVDPVEEAVLMMENLKAQKGITDGLRNVMEAKATGDETLVSEAMAPLAEWRAKGQALFDIERATGRLWGQTGNFRKRLMQQDLSLIKMEADYRVAAKRGGELSEKQVEHVVDTKQKMEKKEKEISDLQEAELDARVEELLGNFFSQARTLQKEASAAKKEGRNLREFLKDSAEAARKRITERQGQLGSGFQILAHLADISVIGAHWIAEGTVKIKEFTARLVKEFGEGAKEHAQTLFDASHELHDTVSSEPAETKKRTAKAKGKAKAEAAVQAAEGATEPDKKTVADIVKALVISGKHGSKVIFPEVVKELKEAFPTLTERRAKEIFSDYGQSSFPNPEPTKKELRELRRIVQLEITIERLQAGQAPLKTGQQRDKSSPEIRALEKEANELKRKHGYKGSRSPEQLAGVLDAIKTRLKNEILDIDARIEAGGSTAKQLKPRQGITYDGEALALKTKRDALKKILDGLDADKKMSVEKRIEQTLDALQKTEELLERQILTGEKPAKSGQPSVTNDEIEERRSYVATLRQALKERAAQKARKPEDQKRIEAAQKELARLERVLEGIESDKTKPKNKGALSQQEEDIKLEIAAMRDVLKEERAADTDYLARDKASIQRRIKVLEERITDKDFASKTKREKKYDDELRKLEGELEEMKERWFNELFEESLKHRTPGDKVVAGIRETFHLARTLQLGMDFGSALRQGLLSIGRQKQFWRAMATATEALRSESAYLRTKLDLVKNPNVAKYREAGLDIVEWDSPSLSKQEEAYMGRWFRKAPRWVLSAYGGTLGAIKGAGGGVAGAVIGSAAGAAVGANAQNLARGQIAFMNKLRVELMDAMSATLSRFGDPTLQEMKDYASFVNISTGRGELHRIEKAGLEVLNTIFLAYRWTKSRVQYLALRPLWYPWMSYARGQRERPTLRSQAVIAGEYSRYLAGLGIFILAWNMAHDDEDEARIELDTNSTRFGKVPAGPTMVDPTAGLAGWATFISRIRPNVLGGGKVKTGGGKTYSLSDDIEDVPRAPFGDSKWTEMTRFVRAKFSPILGAIVNTAAGRDPGGGETGGWTEAGRLFTPLLFDDMQDALKAHGVPAGTAVSLMSFFGLSVHTKDLKNYEQVGEEDRNFLYNNQIVFSELSEHATDGDVAGIATGKQKELGRNKELTDTQRKEILAGSRADVEAALLVVREAVAALPKDDEEEWGLGIKRIENRFSSSIKRARRASWSQIREKESNP